MKISVTFGTGEGKTKIAAFDRALWDAGIANYNLIRLSSVIPEGADVVIGKADMNNKEHGHRLYVVLSEQYESVKGRKAVAGLGWVSANHTRGKGIFVEHGARTEKEVTEYIENTIKSMTAYRPEEHGDIKMKTVEKMCRGNVACAVVAAVYSSEGWE
jgi:arginine decarboxylase